MSTVKKPKPQRPPSAYAKNEHPIDWSWTIVPIGWVLLTLAAYGAYYNSFEGRLFFDDLSSVMGNPHLQAYTNPLNPSTGKPWEGDWERLAYACGAEIDTPFAGRPIVSLSFALNHLWAFRSYPAEIPSFYGVLPPHHTYYHYVNFCFHVIVGLLLWHLLRFTFRAPSVQQYTGRNADLWATAVTLIWMVHPLNTETVVYVTQRTEQVLSFFLLLTIYASARSITSRVPAAWQVLSVVSCALGMASKENMVGVPLLVILYDRAFFYTTWRETFQRRTWLYIALFATYTLLLYINAASFKIGTGFYEAPHYKTLLGSNAILLLCLKHFGRLTAALSLAFVVDRATFFTSWQEAFVKRGPFYAAALFGIFGLIMGQEMISSVTNATTISTLRQDVAQLFSWEWVVDLTMALMLKGPFVLVAGLTLIALDRYLSDLTWAEIQQRSAFYISLLILLMLAFIRTDVGPRGQSVGLGFERMNGWEYLITQCWCLLRYLQLTVVPYGLCVDYGRLAILDPLDVIPGAIVVLSLLGLTVWGWIHKPWVGFIGCWFFFILAPTSSFVPIVTEVGAERRMYLPLAAVLIGIGIGVALLVKKLAGREINSLDDNGRIWVASSAVVLTVIFAVSSVYRNRVYHTESTLYGHIPKTFPWNERGNNNYAKICIDENRIEEAEQLLNQALRIDPEYSDAFTNRGIIYHRRKQMDRAIQNATEALRWNPMNPSAWNNRGNAFIELKLFHKAEADFTKLISLNPRGVEGYYGRANTYYLWGKAASALSDIDSVIERSPGDYKAYNTRGNILKQMGNYEKAVAAFSTGLDLLLKEAASARHPCYQGVQLAMQGKINDVIPFGAGTATAHQVAMQFGNRQTLGTILGNRADAYRNLIDKFPNAKQNMFDDLTRAIILNIDNPVYFLARGQQNYNYKNYPQALADFKEVINRTQTAGQPINVDAFRGLIVAAFELKDWDVIWQAEKTLREAGIPIDGATIQKWREESGREPLP